jgi:hypothetical protein
VFASLRLEARVGIEPTHKGFADLSLTTWVPRPLHKISSPSGMCPLRAAGDLRLPRLANAGQNSRAGQLSGSEDLELMAGIGHGHNAACAGNYRDRTGCARQALGNTIRVYGRRGSDVSIAEA